MISEWAKNSNIVNSVKYFLKTNACKESISDLSTKKHTLNHSLVEEGRHENLNYRGKKKYENFHSKCLVETIMSRGLESGEKLCAHIIWET